MEQESGYPSSLPGYCLNWCPRAFFSLQYVPVYVFVHLFKISAEGRLGRFLNLLLEDLNPVSVSRQIRCFPYPKYLVQIK